MTNSEAPKRFLRALILEDSQDDLDLLLHHLKKEGYEVSYILVETAEAMIKALDNNSFDIILSDYSMPHFSALAALSIMRERKEDLPFIIISGTIGEEIAVEALKAGAHDFFVKGKFSRLGPAIVRELREKVIRQRLKESEMILRQTQKMEAVGKLASGVAHDFNNIIGVITLYCESFATRIKEAQDSKELEQIKLAVERAKNLTSQLLAFSRKQDLELKRADLNEIIKKMGDLLKRLINKRIDLVFHLDPKIHSVVVDTGQMELVLMNLAINARDAMPDGGTFTVATSNVKIDAESAPPDVAPGDYVKMTATDTGCGMSKEILEHIFEPFFTTKGTNGTGLGLATVYGVVKQSGGFLDVSSKEGAGTVFNVYLPADPSRTN